MDYYATLVQEGLNYQPVTLLLRKIQLDPAPIFHGGQGCKKNKIFKIYSKNKIQLYMFIYNFYILDLHCVISESKKKIFSSEIVEVRKGMHTISIPLKHSVALTGDIRVDFFNRPKMKRKVFISLKMR